MRAPVRFAFTFLAFSLAAAAAAADPLPPELAALRAKAESGKAIAQYNLGLAYADGRGVPADLAEAYVWLTLASDQGSTGKYIGVLASRMSAGELAEGKRRLGLLRSRLAVPTPVVHPPAAPAPEKEAPGLCRRPRGTGGPGRGLCLADARVGPGQHGQVHRSPCLADERGQGLRGQTQARPPPFPPRRAHPRRSS